MEIKKNFAQLLALVGLFMFTSVVFFQLQIAFGFNGPTAAPPAGSGAIGANTLAPLQSQVFINTPAASGTAILTVGPDGTTPGPISGISVMNNLISDVNAPIGSKDAANKAYVDAQSGGGAGNTITVYGVGKGTNIALLGAVLSPYSFFVGGATQKFTNCLIGNYEACGLFSPAPDFIPPAGTGANCPAGYSSIFDGYGPYVNLEQKFYKGTAGGGIIIVEGDQSGINATGFVGGEDDPVDAEKNQPSYYIPTFGSMSGATMSICGTNTYQVAKTDYTYLVKNTTTGQINQVKTGVGAAAGIMSACVPQAIGPNQAYFCNTCRICEKQ